MARVVPHVAISRLANPYRKSPSVMKPRQIDKRHANAEDGARIVSDKILISFGISTALIEFAAFHLEQRLVEPPYDRPLDPGQHDLGALSLRTTK